MAIGDDAEYRRMRPSSDLRREGRNVNSRVEFDIEENLRNEGRGLPVHKWKNVQFDGNPANLSRFLVRVTQYAEAENTPDESLFRGRVHLFTGEAADWLATRPDLHSWQQLLTELKEYVRNDSSDMDRLEEIRNTKQGWEVPHTNITKMELLFREFQLAIREKDKVEIILRNLRPSIGRNLLGI